MIPTKQPICINRYTKYINYTMESKYPGIFRGSPWPFCVCISNRAELWSFFYARSFFSAPIPHWWIIWGAFLGLPVGWLDCGFLKPMRVAWIRVFFQNGPPIENEHMWTPSWSTPVFHPWMGFLSEALLEPSKAPEAILRKISISLRRGLQSCRHPKTTLHDEFEDLRAPCLRHAENSTRFLLENFLGDS